MEVCGNEDVSSFSPAASVGVHQELSDEREVDDLCAVFAQLTIPWCVLRTRPGKCRKRDVITMSALQQTTHGVSKKTRQTIGAREQHTFVRKKWRSFYSPIVTTRRSKRSRCVDFVYECADVDENLRKRDEEQRAWIAGLPMLQDTQPLHRCRLEEPVPVNASAAVALSQRAFCSVH